MILSLLCWASGAWASTTTAFCQQWLDPLAEPRRVASTLGRVLPGNFLYGPLKIVRIGPQGDAIASVDYLISRGTLSIEHMEVQPKYRRQGLSKLLLAEVLLAEPAAERIEATLAWTNFEAYWKAFLDEPFVQRLFHPLRAGRRAITATPFYRSFRELGFGRLIDFDVQGEVVRVWLGREPVLAPNS